jgi:4-hydroxybenzoate polyprenyltransferase
MNTNSKFVQYFSAARPHQWIKQILIILPFIALGKNVNLDSLFKLLYVGIVFSITSSMVYIYNDIYDFENDRKDSIKKFRPIANGEIQLEAAHYFAKALFILNIILYFSIYLITESFIPIILIFCYLIFNLGYTKYNLKKNRIIGIGLVGVGFPLRFAIGAEVLNLDFSYWAFVLIYELALVMMIGKRFQKNWRDAGNKNSSLGMESIFWLLALITVIGFFAATYLSFISYDPVIQSWGGFHFLLIGILPLLVGLLRYLELCFIPNSKLEISEYFFKDRILIASGVIYILLMYAGKFHGQ